MNIFVILCLCGVILNAIGVAFVFPLINIAGMVLLLISLFNLKLEGNAVKKAKVYSIVAIVFFVLVIAVRMMGLENVDQQLLILSSGVLTFFYIYVSYYFTESLIQHSKAINELASTRNFRSSWTLMGVVTFFFFMASMYAFNNLIMNVGRIIVLVAALYYCSTIYANKKLF